MEEHISSFSKRKQNTTEFSILAYFIGFETNTITPLCDGIEISSIAIQ